MTGQDLIDLIQRNFLLEKEVYIQDCNGNMFDFKELDTATKRDPYDGDWDQTVNVIRLHDDNSIRG